MTPEERSLISGLFDRMKSFGSPEKDRDAETLIKDAVRVMPDAPYMLVQSVLVQEHALQQANDRIQALEQQVRDLQGREASQGQGAGSGSFLGGLFGGGRAAEPRASSVPQIGSRASPPAFENRAPLAPQAAPSAGASPWQQAAPGAGGGGGGFLRTAMATAAGVAGGVLAAGAIRDLMGGGNTQGNTAANTGNTGAGNTGSNTPAEQPRAEQASHTQPEAGNTDAAHTDADWDGDGFGDFGGDIEV